MLEGIDESSVKVFGVPDAHDGVGGGLHVLQEALEQGRGLGAGGAFLRQQIALVVAVHQAGAAGPLQGGHGVGADLIRVVVGQDVGVLAHADVIALILGVTVKDGGELLAGDLGVGLEGAVGITLDDAVIVGPHHTVDIPGSGDSVAEGRLAFHIGFSLGTMEDGDDHGAGGGIVGREQVAARAVHQAVVHGVLHGFIEPVVLVHVCEAVGQSRGGSQGEDQGHSQQEQHEFAKFSCHCSTSFRDLFINFKKQSF